MMDLWLSDSERQFQREVKQFVEQCIFPLENEASTSGILDKTKTAEL